MNAHGPVHLMTIPKSTLSRKQKALGGFCGAVVLIGFVSFFSYSGTQRFLDSAQWVAHTHEVQLSVQLMQSSLLAAEAAGRGFVINGNPVLLARATAALRIVEQELAQVRSLTADNPSQQKRLDELEPLAARRIVTAERIIAALGKGDNTEAMAVLSSAGEQAAGAGIHARIQELFDEEARFLLVRNEKVKHEARVNQLVILGISLFALLAAMAAFANVYFDLSKREKAEEERDGFFAVSMDMLGVANTRGYFTRVNPAFQETLGYSAEEFCGRPFMELIHPQDLAATLAAVEQLKQGNPVIRFENRYRCKDGTYKWICWMSSPQGPINYCTGRDMTEVRRASEALTFSSKMTALGEMAGGIAHEINNPLQIIHGSSSLLRKLVQRQPMNLELLTKTAQTIESTAIRIGKITQGLRSFAREGKNDPFETRAVGTLVEDTLSFCSEKFKVHKIELRVAAIPKELSIACRPGQISQILLNLLNNGYQAVESIPERWLELAVVDRGSDVEIAVTNSGAEIPAAARARLFQPFFTTKPVGTGMGLGLSISKGIAEAHRGGLSHDAMAVHTRFVLRLPKLQELAV
jgi:PAS domain S-box-containing protein